MKILSRRPAKLYGTLVILLSAFFIGAGVVFVAGQANAQSTEPTPGERLITLHDGGQDKGILTKATTLKDALQEAAILIDPNDIVEPGLDEKLVASTYDVNIYRARPVTVVDGSVRQKVMSPYQTAKQITEHAGISLHDEDITTLEANTDMVSEGAGIQLTIKRATEFTFNFYGTKTTSYTQSKTVSEMLKQKGVTLGENDTLSVPMDTPVTKGMTIELWRNGKQTAVVEEAIAFDTEKIQDADHPIGYRAVKTPGVAGKKKVTYEIDMKNGQEVGRVAIQSVVTQEPAKQVEVIGVKPSGNGLSKAKGVDMFTDSKGVVHRETYYDLPMNKVMGACGGGAYTIRADGAKVDKDGYILIAANLSRYPRCSLVETSLGLGKVYDTGGFVSTYPDGFDLATDWSNNDGN